MDKSLEPLRTFFKVSCAVFDMQRTILDTFMPGRLHQMSPMETLHRIALNEVMKEDPNMKYIDGILTQMESLAEHSNKVSEE